MAEPSVPRLTIKFPIQVSAAYGLHNEGGSELVYDEAQLLLAIVKALRASPIAEVLIKETK